MGDKDAFLARSVLDIVRAANLLERLGGQYAQEADLSSVQQYMVLAMLSTKDSLSMGDLRQNTLVTKQAVTGLVNRLKKAGYIETYKDSQDRRITRACLAEKGREALQTIRPKRISGNREAFSILNDEELSQLSGIMQKLVEHLRTE